jgi:hypothetical protein
MKLFDVLSAVHAAGFCSLSAQLLLPGFVSACIAGGGPT